MYRKQNHPKKGLRGRRLVYSFLTTFMVLVLFGPTPATLAQSAGAPLASSSSLNRANSGLVVGTLSLPPRPYPGYPGCASSGCVGGRGVITIQALDV